MSLAAARWTADSPAPRLLLPEAVPLADEEHEADRSQRREDEQPLLTPIERAARSVRLDPVVRDDWKYGEQGGEQTPAEGLLPVSFG